MSELLVMFLRVRAAGLQPGIASGPPGIAPGGGAWFMGVAAGLPSGTVPAPGACTGTEAQRLIIPLPPGPPATPGPPAAVEGVSLVPGGPALLRAVPRPGVTSAGVQFRLGPSFSVEESSSESSNIRSCRRSGFRGGGDTELNFLGPGRLRGLDSEELEPWDLLGLDDWSDSSSLCSSGSM